MAAGWHQGVAVTLQCSCSEILVAFRKGCMLSILQGSKERGGGRAFGVLGRASRWVLVNKAACRPTTRHVCRSARMRNGAQLSCKWHALRSTLQRIGATHDTETKHMTLTLNT